MMNTYNLMKVILQLQEKGKSEKGHLVNFFSHIDENLNSDDLMQKFENVGKK